MDVTASLTLSDDERKELAKILECPKSELADRLEPFASAAVQELVTMFLGQKVFTRGSDILEYRLLLLVETAFNGQVPSEQQVSKLFQTTASGSRALLRAVMSKYQYQLQDAISGSLKGVLQGAVEKETGIRTVSVLNRNFVDELNRILAHVDPTLPPVVKTRGAVSTYEIAASSYAALKEELNV